MHSVYVEEVGLSSPLTAEQQFVDCVNGALFSMGRKVKSRRRQLQLHQSPCSFSHVKQRQMRPGYRLKNQASLHILYTSQADL